MKILYQCFRTVHEYLSKIEIVVKRQSNWDYFDDVPLSVLAVTMTVNVCRSLIQYLEKDMYSKRDLLMIIDINICDRKSIDHRENWGLWV